MLWSRSSMSWSYFWTWLKGWHQPKIWHGLRADSLTQSFDKLTVLTDNVVSSDKHADVSIVKNNVKKRQIISADDVRRQHSVNWYCWLTPSAINDGPCDTTITSLLQSLISTVNHSKNSEDTKLPIMGVRRALFDFVYVMHKFILWMLFWCFLQLYIRSDLSDSVCQVTQL